MLPKGLAELPPGPQLGAALAGLDLTRCTWADLHTVLGLQSRQLSYEQARLWDVLLETAYAHSDAGDDASSRVRELDEFSGSQAAFTLTWSRPATLRQLSLAEDLIERLAMVFSALRAGPMDPVRAKVFSEALGDQQLERTLRLPPPAPPATPAAPAATLATTSAPSITLTSSTFWSGGGWGRLGERETAD